MVGFDRGSALARKLRPATGLGLMGAAILPLVACGGGSGGSSPSPTPVATIAPTPSPSPTPSPTATAAGTTFQATGGECDGTAGWLAIANDGLDDTAAIRTSLQQAASKGDTLTIPAGTYNINDPDGVTAFFRNANFTIIATGAVFVAGPNVNADLIAFDAASSSFSGPCGGTSLVNMTWVGGELDISRAHLSGTVPQGRGVGATTVGSPVAGTTDGLSVRATQNGSSPRQKGGAITIRALTVVGAPISAANRTAYLQNVATGAPVDSRSDTWQNAGGDSGLFIMGAGSALVENSTFFGIRDASIYVTASPDAANLGGNYVLRNNRFYGGFDGISSKRGAQNLRMENNQFVNVVRAVSLESLSGPLRSAGGTSERIVTPVVITGNVFNGVQRAIQVESANNVTISNNTIRNLGARVAEANAPVRYSRYEGIVIEGVTNGTLTGNTITGIDGARSSASTTVGVTIGTHAGIVGPIMSANVTTGSSNVLSNLDSNIE